MAKINSRAKGAQGERELSKLLREYGISARRGAQFSGSPDSPDVVTNLDNIHIEVKRVQALNIHNAMAQAERDAGDKLPVVCHRKNNTDWLITINLRKFIERFIVGSKGKI